MERKFLFAISTEVLREWVARGAWGDYQKTKNIEEKFHKFPRLTLTLVLSVYPGDVIICV